MTDSHDNRDCPISWKEMFKGASSPASPFLVPSVSCPHLSLGYIPWECQENPRRRREVNRPSIPGKRESVSQAASTASTLEGGNYYCLPNDISHNAHSHDPGALLSQQNFQLAVYTAMAHGVLMFLVLVLCGIWKLLECYRTPIQWAVLCSMPLREIHGTIVAFWEDSLHQGLLGTFLAIPFALCKALIRTALDARLTILHAFGRSRSKQGRTVKFSTLVEWLVSLAVFSLAYENMGAISFVFIPFVVIVFYFLGTCLGLMPVAERIYMDRKHSLLSAEPSQRWDHATTWLAFVFSPLTKVYRFLGVRLTSTLLNNLHHLVAVLLMVMLIVGSFGGLILFSYKIGSEGKGVVIALKFHVQRSNYVQKLGVKRWLEENKVPELIDTYASKAYNTISLQVDEYAAKYQMTEVADVMKEYLVGLARGHRRGDLANTTHVFARSIPSHPVLDMARNITQKLWKYDIKGSCSELYQGLFLLLEHLNIPRDELLEKAKQVGEHWLGVGKHVFANTSIVVSSFMNLLISSTRLVMSGAPGFISFCTDSFVFFSVLHYLVVSKSGGVMEQVLSMIPLSESTRRQCATVLDHAVSSVLLATVKAAFFQASFTWLLFHFLRIHFLYMSTLLAFLSALLPLVPTWWSSIPAGAQLALKGHYIQAVIVMVVHEWFMDYGVSAIQSGIPDHNAYLTGLSIAGGMALFSSAIEGAIMGPLLMTVAISLKNLYVEFVLSTPKKVGIEK